VKTWFFALFLIFSPLCVWGLRVRRSNFMRSKFNFFIRSNFWSWGGNCVCSWGQICPIILIRRLTLWSWDQNSINLLVPSTIMRSKFKINYINLVSCTCGKFLALIISHLCIKTFDLMITLAANKLIMRSKLPKNALF